MKNVNYDHAKVQLIKYLQSLNLTESELEEIMIHAQIMSKAAIDDLHNKVVQTTASHREYL